MWGGASGTYIPWKKAAVHFFCQSKNADLIPQCRLTQEWNGSKNLHLSTFCGTHSSCFFCVLTRKCSVGTSRSKDTPGAPPDKLQCKWYWLNPSQHEKDEGGGWLVLRRTISLCFINWFNGDLWEGGHNEQVGWSVLCPGACCLSCSGSRKTKQVWCKLGETWGNHLRCQLTLGLGGGAGRGSWLSWRL